MGAEMKSRGWQAIVVAAVLWTSSATAVGYDRLAFSRATPGVWSIDDGSLIPTGAGVLRLSGGLSSGALTCTSDAGSVPLVASSQTVGLALGLGLADGLELSAAMPLGWLDAQTSSCARPVATLDRAVTPGDAELRLRLRLLDTDGLATFVAVRLPTGWFSLTDHGQLVGDPLGNVSGGVTGSASAFGVRATGHAGVVVRPIDAPVARVTFGGGVTGGVGLEVGLTRSVSLAGEVAGDVLRVNGGGASGFQVPVEGIVGVRYRDGPLEAGVGVGGGIFDGIGTPSMRATANIAWRFGAPMPTRPPLRVDELMGRAPPTPKEAARRRAATDLRRRAHCPPGELLPGCPAPKQQPRPEAEPVVVEDASPPVTARVVRTIVEQRVDHVVERIVTVTFDDGDATVGAAWVAILAREVGPVLAQAEAVVLEGHASAPGSSTSNVDLARARAEAVRRVLLELGARETVLSVRAFGEDVPLTTDDDANRRVRVVVITRVDHGVVTLSTDTPEQP